MSAKNPALDLAVVTYLPERHLELFKAEQFLNRLGKSELGRRIYRDYYSKMSPHDKRLLEETYNKMTPEQKQNPNRRKDGDE